jgi:predicted  nucleic acid-binding Zn-ribbon protein
MILSRLKLIGVLLAITIIAAESFALIHFIQKNERLRIEAAVAQAQSKKILGDLAANRKAVEALSASYREVYTQYREAERAVRARQTAKKLNAEPTQVSQQIEDEINRLFREIEEGM